MEDFDKDNRTVFDDEVLDYIIYEDINDGSKGHKNPPRGGCLPVFLVLLLVILLLGPVMGGII